MRYVKTVDLWNADILAQIEAGALRLQPGQWVRCGSERPSRLDRIYISRGTISYIRAFHAPAAGAKYQSYVTRFRKVA